MNKKSKAEQIFIIFIVVISISIGTVFIAACSTPLGGCIKYEDVDGLNNDWNECYIGPRCMETGMTCGKYAYFNYFDCSICGDCLSYYQTSGGKCGENQWGCELFGCTFCGHDFIWAVKTTKELAETD